MIINEKNKAEKGTESAGSMIQGLREGDSRVVKKGLTVA